MKSTITDKLVKTQKEEVDGLIGNLEAMVNPNTPVLDSQQRQQYGKGNGNANKLLITDVRNLTFNHPQLKSPLIDWEEFELDNTASAVIDGWISRLNSLVYKLESAKMMHDYDNYNDAIDQYAHLDYLGRNNVQGAAEAHRQIKEHFKRSKPAKAE